MAAARVFVVGRIGKDPEQQVVGQDGKTIRMKFSLAADDDRIPKEGEERKTHWYNTTVFLQATSKLPNHLVKGKQIAIMGGKWTTSTVAQEDGTKRTFNNLECNGSDIQLIGGNSQGGGNATNSATPPFAGGAATNGAAAWSGDPNDLPPGF